MNRNGRRRPREQAQPADVKYPHSPLVEVVFEIRFPGEPAVECHRDKFFDLVRGQYPAVAVPHAEAGQAIALQPYHFKSLDQSETVMVALNRFAYSTRRYESFQRFGPRALGLARQFCRCFKIEKLNRTGLRYVNAIPFAREGGAVPWRRYFTIDISLPATEATDFLNAALAFETRCEAGAITTRITCAKGAGDAPEVFVLDFDFGKTEGLTASKLGKYMDESHEHTKKLFEGILCEDYKAVMRGEVVA